MNPPETGPRIIHVSADYPDPFVSDKTQAIRRLVKLTNDRFEHHVFSLNRVSPSPASILKARFRTTEFSDGIALAYEAPPLGIAHRASLRNLGLALADRIARQPSRPSLIVGHKLTIEGFAVATAARELGLPYAITVQGNTDDKILGMRPDLHASLQRVWRGASAVFAFAPWALSAIERRLGPPTCSPHILPCPLASDSMIPPAPSEPNLVSVFRLDTWKTKNFDGLVAALGILAAADASLPLAIVGGGSVASLARCRAIARAAPNIVFEGALTPEAVAQRLNQASAMVLPSRRESFGMVFIEALFAGCPIIYPAGAAVDGFFDGAPFALRVASSSPADIAGAMRHAVENAADMKAALAKWQDSPGPERFKRSAIAATFATGLADAISM